MVTFGQIFSCYCFFIVYLLLNCLFIVTEEKKRICTFLPISLFSSPFEGSFFRFVPFFNFALGLSQDVHYSWFWCCTFVQHLPEVLDNPSWSFHLNTEGLEIWSRTAVEGSPLNCENLADPVSFEMHHLFPLFMKASGTVLPGQIPIWQNENKNLKPSPKFIWARRVANSLQWHFSGWDWRCELPSGVYEYLSISAETILWFPFWEKGFCVVTCQNWEVPFLIKTSVFLTSQRAENTNLSL